MIAVVDYGLGNLRSVSKALETVGAKVETTGEPEKIAEADGIVLPGVGAFYHGITNLEKLGIIPVLRKAVIQGKPFLGICLGLQLLFSETEEHGIHKGLNIIEGRVKKFTDGVKIPHIGWNQAKFEMPKCKIFEGIPDESYFYFAHSYYVEPDDRTIIATTTEYGIEFTSSIVKNNVLGVQFHPEKSSSPGLKILENFLKLC